MLSGKVSFVGVRACPGRKRMGGKGEKRDGNWAKDGARDGTRAAVRMCSCEIRS